MTESSAAPLKKTALHATHVALGARMVPYAGWEMPVEYSGISAEHLAVRSAAGLFDVSHMGEIEIAGKDALAAVQRISSNDASRLQVNQAHYAALTTPDGTFVDDMLVYRFGPSHFLLVVNGSNEEKDYAWIAKHAPEAGDVAVVNSSSRYALIAVQGPKALPIVQSLTGDRSRGHQVLLVRARRGGRRARHRVADRLHRRGRVRDLLPAGDGAARVGRGHGGREERRAHPVRPRRARHAAPRSGDAAVRQRHRRDDQRARGRSGLDCRLEEGRLHRPRGRCDRQKASGVARKIVGFAMVDRAIARHGHLVMQGDAADRATSPAARRRRSSRRPSAWPTCRAP